MKILVLYAEVMGYTLSTLRALQKLGADIYLIHEIEKKLTPFEFEKTVTFPSFPVEQFDDHELSQVVTNFEPDLVFISGWNNKRYRRIARMMRQRGVAVVMGLDNQWKGSLKQWIAVFLGKFGAFRIFYSHAWVAGRLQYDYARRLGFSSTSIISNLYSADTALFTSQEHKAERQPYPHEFLFVGRFADVKGIDVLIKAWRLIGAEKKNWRVKLIGANASAADYSFPAEFEVMDFLAPERLAVEAKKSGCFILPSRDEPWGLVVHEMASIGLPIIAADCVGAASEFVIHGHNGFVFETGNEISLREAMQSIINQSDESLREMSERSTYLASRISPEISAASLLSVGKYKK